MKTRADSKKKKDKSIIEKELTAMIQAVLRSCIQ